jgi:hypothetical protein
MPTYDYKRADGTVFEAVRSYGEHKVGYDTNGVPGYLVWLTSPATVVPPWHQSAPSEDADTIKMLKRANDKSDPVRVLESGEDQDVRRRVRERGEKEDAALDRNITETMREHDIPVPE